MLLMVLYQHSEGMYYIHLQDDSQLPTRAYDIITLQKARHLHHCLKSNKEFEVQLFYKLKLINITL